MSAIEQAVPEEPDWLAEQQEYEAELFRSMGLDAMPDPGSPEIDVVIDRALERIAEAKAEMERNTAVMERRIQMLRDWCEEQNAVVKRRVEWDERTVRMFADRYDFGNKRSRSLPSGTFGFRKAPDRLVIQDADKALAFAKRTPQLAGEIKVTETIPTTPLKQWAQSTGEVPDGCEFVGGEDVFFVKV